MHRPPFAANDDTEDNARLRRNRVFSTLIIVTVILVIGWTWLVSPARKVDRTEASYLPAPASSPSAGAQDATLMPSGLRAMWATDSSISETLPSTSPSPLVMGSTLIIAENRGVRAVALSDGSERWHYRRDIDLCGVSGSDNQVYATFRGPTGCGETVALDPDTGAYKATRKSIGSESPAVIRSNTYAGVYDTQSLELWRDDLVRVVEYGKIPASAEPGLQPHENCSIVSALTRVEFLAVINNCEGQGRLILQDANPKESRKPEVKSDIELGPVTTDMSVVAIGQDTAAVLADNRIRVFRADGSQLSETELHADGEEAGSGATSLNSSVTADLPHQMTWWSSRGLMGFRPSTLEPVFEFPEALGTPAPWGNHILMPVADGIAVIDGVTLEVIGTVPLPTAAPQPETATAEELPSADASDGKPIRLAVVGDTLIVQRGGRVSAYAIEV